MTPEQVTDAMLDALRSKFAETNPGLGMPAGLARALCAAAINASGCVLVPREPTEAVRRAIGGAPIAGYGVNPDGLYDRIYRAMLAAAETPSAASSEREGDRD